jgi:protein-tyrosine phosphatase
MIGGGGSPIMSKWVPLLLALVLPMVAIGDEPESVAVPSGSIGVLATAPNFRDIGGYPAAAGRHVARGRIYRSSELSSLSPADAAAVATLHLSAVVDLRTAEERRRAPSIWAARPADVFESPKLTLAPFTHAVLAGATTAEGARQGIKGFYRQMPRLYQEEYAALFHRIARGELPLLVHCTAGKDRTGVAIAVLLEALGTPRSVAIRDYALTNARLAASANAAGTPSVGAKTASVSAMSKLPPEALRAMWEANPEYIEAALNSIDAGFGSVEGYLHQALGVSDDDLRNIRRSLTE